jgi:hypothetical protein
MRTNRMGKRMKDQVGIPTSFFGLTPDISTDLNGMIRQLPEEFDKVLPGIIQPAT